MITATELNTGPLLHYALPALLAVAVAEGLVYARRRKHPFDWKSSIASVVVAGGHKLESMVTAVLAVSLFNWALAHRIADIPVNTWWGLGGLYLTAEFFYYWQHRLSHEIRWFWATHSVHHSAEQLTVTANYRHGWTGTISGLAVLYLPLVLLGFPPKAVLEMLGLIILAQFWIHTELIGRLGWLDRIFNTPSNHRVHHARNAEYLDRNYGGTLVIFDQLFGTYTAERDDIAIEYGLLGKEGSLNPFVLVFREWMAIFRDVAQARKWRDRWGYLIGKPGWTPEGSTVSASPPDDTAKAPR